MHMTSLAITSNQICQSFTWYFYFLLKKTFLTSNIYFRGSRYVFKRPNWRHGSSPSTTDFFATFEPTPFTLLYLWSSVRPLSRKLGTKGQNNQRQNCRAKNWDRYRVLGIVPGRHVWWRSHIDKTVYGQDYMKDLFRICYRLSAVISHHSRE